MMGTEGEPGATVQELSGSSMAAARQVSGTSPFLAIA